MKQTFNKEKLVARTIAVFVILVLLTLYYTIREKQILTNTNIKDIEWIREIDNKKETLILKENKEFLYYDTDSGEKIKGFENCTSYELNDKTIKLNCGKEIKLITYGKTNLFLKINDETATFTKNTSNNFYKIYNVGYLDNVSKSLIIDNYSDFTVYLDKNNNKVYDGDGNVESTSVDIIKNSYTEDYFNNNNLAIYYIKTNSGSIRIGNVTTNIVDNELILNYDLISPEIGTMDMNGFMIIIEIDKTITACK